MADVTVPSPDPKEADCHKIGQVLARVGEKWSMLVVMLLVDRPRRFSDMKRGINGISQRMLTLCLRGLERDGLIKRTVVAVMPPHVEYELTLLGRSLAEPVTALGLWASRHIGEIDTARAEFDAKDRGDSTPWQR
jgi:DNA-binding HxlR family transcriptional regulator